MRNKVHMLAALLILITLTGSAPILTTYSSNSKPVVVTTSSVLASIVRDLAGDQVIVEVIASPSVCPAHYGVKPSDVYKLKDADLILRQGFEPWLKDLVKASGSKAPVVTIKGPWNTPEFLKARYKAVANALEEYIGINVSAKLRKCLKAIDDTGAWLKEYAKEKGFVGTPVVIMQWQKAYVSFLGFKIVATYPPPEKVTPSLYNEIIKNATENKALLVIDNLQSGTEFGEKLADEIGGVEVALTNFPGITLELNNVTEVMKHNAELLAQALSFAKLKKSPTEIGELYRKVSNYEHEAKLWKSAFIASAVLNIALIVSVAVLVTKLRRR